MSEDSEEQNSSRQILKASSIIGAASIINIAIGLIRFKVLAYVLGPAGVGVMGLLSSVLATASTLFGFGLSDSGTKEIAAHKDEPKRRGEVRKTLLICHAVFGVLGMLFVWLFRVNIAVAIFGDIQYALTVGWVGVGVFASLLGSAQVAVLRGLRQIPQIAKVTVSSAVANTTVGIASILLLGEKGLVLFVIAGPFTTAAVAWFYTSKLTIDQTQKFVLKEFFSHAKPMLLLGSVFMLTGLMAHATHLFVRSIITSELDLYSTGLFTAAWAISTQYIGFVLSSLGTDYYPRLVEVAKDDGKMNNIVAQQATISLLLAGPLALMMVAVAPLALTVLYTDEFVSVSNVLRWQAFGDIIKVAAWPMGFVLAARNERRLYLFTQTFWFAIYALAILFLLPRFGLDVAGYAYFGCYAAGFFINCAICYRLTGFRYSWKFLGLLATYLCTGAAVILLSSFGEIYALIIGVACAVLLGLYSVRELSHLAVPEGRLAKLLRKF